MKILTTVSALFASLILLFATSATAAPILLVNGGMITGAKNVNVAGTLYDVNFKDGTCMALFNGCVQAEFAFQNMADANEAADALRQVLVDGPAGNFDSQAGMTQGCLSVELCISLVPFGPYTDFSFLSAGFWNDSSGEDTVSLFAASNSMDSSDNRAINFAIFSLADSRSEVPEPASIALFGLALAGLTLTRRHKAQ